MGIQHPGFPPVEGLAPISDFGERPSDLATRPPNSRTTSSDRLSPVDAQFKQPPASPKEKEKRSSIIRSATKRRSPTISGAIGGAGSPPSSFHAPASPTRGSILGISPSAHASTPSLQPSASASSVVLAGGVVLGVDPSLSPTSIEAIAAASGWPQEFFSDFASRLWLTYRSGFAPIRDMALEELEPVRSEPSKGALSTLTSALTGRRGLTSDAGWGCMLRTGQSLLANALVVAWMGRGALALYIHLISLFLDSPSPSAPFSVHRMALAGRALGKDVGQWFGPSTAAGAIKALVNAYPDAGLGVAIAEDGVVYQTQASKRRQKEREREWGDQPVLVLLGIRLGLDGVNPIYYDTIKQLYTFPQSLGIAGGRPSSSYYFVGAQAGDLFYLDPHHARPTVPLREVGEVKISATPPATQAAEASDSQDALAPPKEGLTRSATTADKKRSKKEKRLSFDTDVEKSDAGGKVSKHKRRHSQHLAAALANASAASSASAGSVLDEPTPVMAPLPPPFIPREPVDVPLTPHSTAPTLPPALAAHYLAGYTAAETRTFHCERVRKMPMSGLDPSMLIGFLCKDRADWEDWRARVSKLPKAIFAVQDEPPNWMPSDVESMSDELIYDDDESEMTDEEGEGVDFEGEAAANPVKPKIDARRLSEDLPLDDNDNDSEATSTSRTEDEDNVDPVTPGPHDTRFAIPEPQGRAKDICDDMHIDDLGGSGDIADDWIEPSPPPTRHSSTTSPPQSSPPVASPPSIASAPSSASSSSPPPLLAKKKTKRKDKSKAVPVPRVTIPSDSAPVAFPRSDAKGEEDDWAENDEVYYSARDNERSDDAFVNVHVKPKERRMHTARARDGGRTQSGGVRGIMTESSS
ncbi:peptidase family C54-domain-containing protein [Schizophyllum commune]